MLQNGLSQKAKIVFILTGVFVGLLVTAQFRSAIPTTTFPYDELDAQQDLIESYTDEQEILKNKIVYLREQIQLKQAEASQTIEQSNLDLLNSLKEEVGLTTLKGEGIEIIMNDGIKRDPANVDQYLIHAADLRDVINVLFAAGAEAVAINDQRVINSTTINAIGNTILVNNAHLAAPFTIKALGDPEILSNRLHQLDPLPDLKKRFFEDKIQFQISKKNLLTVPLYTSDLHFKFLEKAS